MYKTFYCSTKLDGFLHTATDLCPQDTLFSYSCQAKMCYTEKDKNRLSLFVNRYTMGATLSKKGVQSFLQSQFIMNVATISDNKPHESVLLYFMNDDFQFFFVTHKETYKAKNLLKNPAVSLAVWKHGEMMVQADGTAEDVTATEDAATIMDKLADAATNDEHFWPPLFRIGGDAYIIFKITPTWMRALDLQSNTITSEEPPFLAIDL